MVVYISDGVESLAYEISSEYCRIHCPQTDLIRFFLGRNEISQPFGNIQEAPSSIVQI